MKPEYNKITNNEFYKSVFKKYNSVILIIDAEYGNIIECNDLALNFYGYSKKELLSLKIFDLNQLPEDEVKKLMRKVENNKKNNFNFEHKTKYNEIKKVSVRSIPIVFNKRTILFSVIRDLKSINLQKKYIDSFINNTSYAVAILDDKAHYERVNKEFEHLFGYKENEVLNKTPGELIHSKKIEFKDKLNILNHVGFLKEEVTRFNKNKEKINVEMTVFCIYYNKSTRKIISIYRDIGEKYKLMERLEYNAKYDCLTNIFNRGHGLKLLEKYWDIYMEQENEFSILFIDIDNMKMANDKYGHTFGDKVIKKVIEILKLCLRSTDVISRFGGDEFLVILPGMQKKDLYMTISKIKNKFKKNEYVLSKEYKISVSIGEAINKEKGVIDPGSMISKADRNMYIEKEKKKC